MGVTEEKSREEKRERGREMKAERERGGVEEGSRSKHSNAHVAGKLHVHRKYSHTAFFNPHNTEVSLINKPPTLATESQMLHAKHHNTLCTHTYNILHTHTFNAHCMWPLRGMAPWLGKRSSRHTYIPTKRVQVQSGGVGGLGGTLQVNTLVLQGCRTAGALVTGYDVSYSDVYTWV